MNDLVFVEGEKSDLYKHLDSQFAVTTLSAVADLAPVFSRVMCDYLRDRIVANTSRIFPGTRVQQGKHPGIAFESQIFRIQYTADPITDRDVLPFFIMEHGGDGPQPTPHKAANAVNLPEVAQYKKIAFSIDPRLRFNESLLDSLSRGLFSAGYQWLSNKLTYCIKLETANISTVLYDYMRAMLAENDELLGGFLFSCLMDSKDFVILDEIVAHGALRLAEGRASRFQRPKESLVLQLMGEVVRANESAIVDACANSDETTIIPLTAESKYYRSDEEFFDSMAAVWGKEVICQPIIRSGQLRLVAFYPPQSAATLTPIVSAHTPALGQLAEKQASLIQKHLKLLETVLAPAAPSPPAPKTGRWLGVAEIVGTVSGVFAGRVIKTVSE